MEPFKQEWEILKNKRWQRVKKFLRYCPSRATLQKHFIFRKFGSLFLIPQLWSFAYKPMRNAYYAGWILTWFPVMGIQIPCAILLALVCRANLLVLITLQLLSNPLTIGFMYPMEFYVGKWLCGWLPFPIAFIEQANLHDLLFAIKSGSWGTLISIGAGGFCLACIGGTLIGIACALVTCWVHKCLYRHSIVTYEQFVAYKQKELNKLQKNVDK